MHSPIRNLLRPNSDPTPICCSAEISTVEHLSPTFFIASHLPHVFIEILPQAETMESCVWLVRAKLANGPLIRVGTVQTLWASLYFIEQRCFSLSTGCGFAPWYHFYVEFSIGDWSPKVTLICTRSQIPRVFRLTYWHVKEKKKWRRTYCWMISFNCKQHGFDPSL